MRCKSRGSNIWKFLVFHLVLKPLICRNYRLRQAGKIPDEWYWADKLALDWGYFIYDYR